MRGVPSSLKVLPGVGLGGGVKLLIYIYGGGQPGNPSGYTPLLLLHYSAVLLSESGIECGFDTGFI